MPETLLVSYQFNNTSLLQIIQKKTPCWIQTSPEGQEKQRQRDYVIQKANILSFQGPTCRL